MLRTKRALVWFWLFESARSVASPRKLGAGVGAWFMAMALALPVLPSAVAVDSPTTDAETLIRDGHWKRARAILEPQVQAHPQDARDDYLLAEVRMAFKQFDQALPPAQQAVNLAGNVSDYHLKLGQVYGHLAEQAGVWSAGPLALKFRRQVELALKLDPNNLEALESLMLFKYRAPRVIGGDKEEAHALAGRITALNPSQGYLAQAELAELDNNTSLMEADDLRAVAANPGNYDAQTALAEFYSQSNHARLDEAVKHAEEARRLNPQRIDAYWILARVFALQSRWSDLDRTLAAAEKNVPDDLRPYYEAAKALLETGRDFHRAEAFARKYLSQEPEGEEPGYAEANQLVAQILQKEGRRAAARWEKPAVRSCRTVSYGASIDRKMPNA